MPQEKTKKKSAWSWTIEESDLKNQIDNYSTLKITESYRGISVLIYAVILVISLALGYFGIYTDLETILWGMVLYLPILFFVYKGHRWAIILLMALWTLEKGVQVYDIVEAGSGSVVMPVFWWFIIMPYFWKALKVENERRKVLTPLQVDVGESIFCHECGERLNTSSKFCPKCGAEVSSHN